jgi:hypothetical protein
MNLAVINTKTNIVGIYSDRVCVALVHFQSNLSAERVERLRVNPALFLAVESVK